MTDLLLARRRARRRPAAPTRRSSTAMVAVEAAWLDALVAAGIAPAAAAGRPAPASSAPRDVAGARGRRRGRRQPGHRRWWRCCASGSRDRNPEAARWLHRGLTSQDVLDTALVLCAARRRRPRVRGELDARSARWPRWPTRTATTPMVGADPDPARRAHTFGLKAAQWLHRRPRRARRPGARSRFPVQVGGAAGTLAAAVELAGDRATPRRRAGLRAELAERLGLAAAPPVAHHRGDRHPARRRAGRAPPTPGAASPTTCSTLAPPRDRRARRGRAAGGSSTMPHKANPVLSVLVRRAALTDAAARRHPAPRRRRARSTSAPTAPGTPSGRRCARSRGVPSSPARRPPSCWPGLQVARRPDGAPRSTAARDDVLRRAAQHGRARRRRDRGATAAYLGATGRLVDGVLDRLAPRPRRPR